MDIVIVLIPLATALGALFGLLFVRSAMGGQFEDLDDPPLRILYDDSPPDEV